MRPRKVRIVLSLHNAGCLPGLLAREIAEVEQLRRHRIVQSTAEEDGDLVAYLDQLRACLKAAHAARREAVGPEVWARLQRIGLAPSEADP